MSPNPDAVTPGSRTQSQAENSRQSYRSFHRPMRGQSFLSVVSLTSTNTSLDEHGRQHFHLYSFDN